MKKLTFINSDLSELVLTDSPYAVTKLDGMSAPDLNVQQQRAPYQNGSTYVASNYEPREITMEGAIVAGLTSKAAQEGYRRDLILALAGGMGVLRYENEIGIFDIPAIAVSSPSFRWPTPGDNFLRFQIQFLCPDPFYKSTIAKTYQGIFVATYWEFPAAGFEFTSGGVELSTVAAISGQTILVNNAGDYEAPFQIDFLGPATNPKITNSNTDEYIQINKVLALGETMRVSTEFGNKRVWIITDGVAVNGSQYLNAGSTFFQLPRGITPLEMEDDGAAVGAVSTVTFYERYIGV